MTGHGVGQAEVSGGGTILAEVRSVNNRHLKISLRLCDGLGGYESNVENAVRSSVRRGSIQLNLRWQNRPALDVYEIQSAVAESYVRQCRELSARLGIEPAIRWSDLVNLPGIVSEPVAKGEDGPQLENSVLQAVGQSLMELQGMRAREGAAMQQEFKQQLVSLRDKLELIDARIPQVMADYRSRLKSRVSAAIAESLGASLPTDSANTIGLESDSDDQPQLESAASSNRVLHQLVQDTDLLREVALMADRCDIREEVVRLRSHFSQFDDLLRGSESQGRRLDFLVQEMFREANTIGSKASDALISQHVVEIKATLEQVREMLQNVE